MYYKLTHILVLDGNEETSRIVTHIFVFFFFKLLCGTEALLVIVKCSFFKKWYVVCLKFNTPTSKKTRGTEYLWLIFYFKKLNTWYFLNILPLLVYNVHWVPNRQCLILTRPRGLKNITVEQSPKWYTKCPYTTTKWIWQRTGSNSRSRKSV